MQDQAARGAALPLLLQQLQQLRAGEVHADQGIVKGHDAEQLTVADGQGAIEVRTHTAWVGKCNERWRCAVHRPRGSGQKCVADQRAQRALAPRRLLPVQRPGDTANGQVGNRRRQVAIAAHDGGNLRVWR